VTRRYRLPVPATVGIAGGIAWTGPSAGGTDRLGWSKLLQAAWAVTSVDPGGIDPAVAVRPSGGQYGRPLKQSNTVSSLIRLLLQTFFCRIRYFKHLLLHVF
jgi:hypothetical protein